MDKYSILKNSELFKNLDEQAIQAISSISDLITYKKNNLIFLNGDKATHIYVILKGYVKLYKASFRGDETVIRISGPKQIFGELPCITKQYHILSAQALNNVSILKVPQKDFLKAVKIDENYNNILQKHFFDKYFKIVNNFEKSSSLNIEEKLASLLLKISEDNSNHNHFKLPYNKRIIASQLSTKPETISRAFKYLENQNFLKVQNRDITIINKSSLEDFCKL